MTAIYQRKSWLVRKHEAILRLWPHGWPKLCPCMLGIVGDRSLGCSWLHLCSWNGCIIKGWKAEKLLGIKHRDQGSSPKLERSEADGALEALGDMNSGFQCPMIWGFLSAIYRAQTWGSSTEDLWWFVLGFDFLTLRSAHICTLRGQVPVEAAALRADAAVAEAEQSEKEKPWITFGNQCLRLNVAQRSVEWRDQCEVLLDKVRKLEKGVLHVVGMLVSSKVRQPETRRKHKKTVHNCGARCAAVKLKSVTDPKWS